MALTSQHGSFSCLQQQVDRLVSAFVLKYGVAVWRVTNWDSTESDPCDTVEGCRNGDATERRSAYAEATAATLCAMVDKSADKYEIGGEGVA